MQSPARRCDRRIEYKPMPLMKYYTECFLTYAKITLKNGRAIDEKRPWNVISEKTFANLFLLKITPMRTLFAQMLTIFLALQGISQSKSIPILDKSIMDVSYFPVNYPILKIQDKVKDGPVMRVIYSRPQKSGREVFGGLVEYGQVWRMGANEATELECFRDITFGNIKIKKGRYSIYAIPQKETWTMIVNRETDTWGAFKYDVKKDVARWEVKSEKVTEPADACSIYFEPTAKGANMIVQWDITRVVIPVQF